MTLYKVGELFYWAETADEARAMGDKETNVERVWASNEDPRFRGYIVQ